MTMNSTDLKAADRRYYRGRLGAVYSRTGTVFRVWQPFAESAVLRLYNADGERIFSAPMTRGVKSADGIFEYEKRGDLDGVWYDYLITRNGETVQSADPYAALVTADGKRGQVVDMRRHAPDGWETERNVSHTDPIIYELSVRDFSMDESAGFANRGKFSAFSEEGVCNSHGATVGLDYIRSLGVTHIQLMPIFDFDLDGGGYNWGYNPRFYNAPSALYSRSDGVYELRRLVMAAHSRGLGVVFDVVYNHVFSAEDSAFGRIFPRYYFRGKGGYSNGSGCGNEFASERKTARKFILDSLEFIAREYKADGFRFDLMGLLDIRTLREAERRLRRINPDILLYGEGWTGGASPYPERYRAVLRNARSLPGFAFFNDSFRDGVKGSVFCAEDRGYVNGAPDSAHLEPIRQALTGRFSGSFWTDSAAQTVNYAECHDNLTLFDKLKVTLGEKELIERADKMAAALIMLSRGIAFIQAGQELLRTKNGDENSYCSPDSVNSVKWNSLSENRGIAEYYRGLAAFRRRFGGIADRRVETLGGGFVMTFGDFIFIVNPTGKRLTVHRLTAAPLTEKHSAAAPPTANGRGFEVYADGKRASDAPLYTRKRLICAEYSILIARRTENDTD